MGDAKAWFSLFYRKTNGGLLRLKGLAQRHVVGGCGAGSWRGGSILASKPCKHRVCLLPPQPGFASAFGTSQAGLPEMVDAV